VLIAGAAQRFTRAVHRRVDVGGRAMLQVPRVVVVLFLVDVVVRGLERLERVVQAAVIWLVGIARGMVLEVLAVVDRRFLDLVDRRIDVGDRLRLVPLDVRIAVTALQVPARLTQIGQRMKICRVLARLVRGDRTVERGEREREWDERSRQLAGALALLLLLHHHHHRQHHRRAAAAVVVLTQSGERLLHHLHHLHDGVVQVVIGGAAGAHPGAAPDLRQQFGRNRHQVGVSHAGR
jgi:hypothetical protein